MRKPVYAEDYPEEVLAKMQKNAYHPAYSILSPDSLHAVSPDQIDNCFNCFSHLLLYRNGGRMIFFLWAITTESSMVSTSFCFLHISACSAHHLHCHKPIIQKDLYRKDRWLHRMPAESVPRCFPFLPHKKLPYCRQERPRKDTSEKDPH